MPWPPFYVLDRKSLSLRSEPLRLTAIPEAALGYFLIVDVFETLTLSPSTSEERCSVLHDLKDFLTFEDALETCFHALFP